jgi:hypothetical protein
MPALSAASLARPRTEELSRYVNNMHTWARKENIDELQAAAFTYQPFLFNSKAAAQLTMVLMDVPGYETLDSDELRSMSDKALGALRVAVAHDEALRDALRLSEGNRSTEQKQPSHSPSFAHDSVDSIEDDATSERETYDINIVRNLTYIRCQLSGCSLSILFRFVPIA